MTALERYHADLREIGCIFCLRWRGIADTPASLHHVGDPHRRSEWMVVPLCKPDHQGPLGYHGLGGESGFRARYKIGEHELLAWTNEEYVKRRVAR